MYVLYIYFYILTDMLYSDCPFLKCQNVLGEKKKNLVSAIPYGNYVSFPYDPLYTTLKLSHCDLNKALKAGTITHVARCSTAYC